MMYEKLCSYENLLSAFEKSSKGKVRKHYVIKFRKNLKENLLKLQKELIAQTYEPKPLKTIIISDPKTRKISKSKYRDRVVHHVLISLIGPVFEPTFIYDSFANQIGKGTLKAIERFHYFKRKVSKNNTLPCYVLKADIKHYFEEVNHEILLSILKEKISDERVIWLIKKILSNMSPSGGGERLRGMPLGNHTSQWFANIYLDKFDKFVKHELRAKYYIRYVDDFVIFSNSKVELENWKMQIDQFLREKLRLELHPDKSQIIPLNQGINFLGLKIFYHYSLIRESNRKNFERKLKELKILYREGQINREQVVESLEGWLAFAKHANSYRYRRDLLRNFNKNFPIKDKSQIIRSKKIKNFFRKVYASKTDFSVQKTLLLFQKGFAIKQIAETRSIKEGTIWNHFSNLIEHSQLSIWKIMPKKKIVKIIAKIRDSSESLKQMRERVKDKDISYDEIACVRAHLKMKQKILKNLKVRKFLLIHGN